MARSQTSGQVGDALQLRRDLHGRGHEAQVDRGRLHHGDQLDGVLVDLQLHLVDAVSPSMTSLGQRGVALQQRADGLR